MPRYKVKQNDWLSKIAREGGFRDNGEAIWNANPDVFYKGKNIGSLQEVTGGNPDILMPDWEFDVSGKKEREDSRASGQTHNFQRPNPKKVLSLILRDSEGEPVQDTWNYRFVQKGKTSVTGASDQGKIVITALDESISDATLTLFYPHTGGFLELLSETVALHVGGLDPILTGPEGVAAVQKILTNLGLYEGSIDGVVGPKMGAAIVTFKNTHDFAQVDTTLTQELFQKLQEAQGLRLGIVDRPSGGKEKQDDLQPLPLGKQADFTREIVTSFSEYEEPTDNEQTGPGLPFPGRKSLSVSKSLRLFPAVAYVAPCADGEQDQKINTLQMITRRFLFLDAGNFYSNHTTFGLIWGRHVYLCNYRGTREADPAKESPSAFGKILEWTADAQKHSTDDQAGSSAGGTARTEGLDALFFAAMGANVEVLKHASASWAPHSDFDWDQLFLVIPDMHLMTQETAQIWHRKPGVLAEYDFKVELQLLDFAEKLSRAKDTEGFEKLGDSLQIVQIGDSYDLWIGFDPCLFTKNDTRQVLLEREDAPATISAWVDAIRSSQPEGHEQNPAIEALELLAKNFGDIEYLYGNHDNYLIRQDVCEAAGLAYRKRWVEYPGLFIEHGHRLEATFASGVETIGNIGVTVVEAVEDLLGIKPDAPKFLRGMQARNYDGNQTGYNAARDFAYVPLKGGATDPIKGAQSDKAFADIWAEAHDQPQYWGEYAQVWLGRLAGGQHKCPHIFVIGHTHIPELLEIRMLPIPIGLPEIF